MTGTAWQNWITFAVAVLGAVLGVMNTWQSMRRDRVRLRVRPRSVIPLGRANFDFGIEVINLSTFPVTIDDVGITLDGRSAKRGERAPIVSPILPDGGPWPRRLEPREAFTAYFNSSGFLDLARSIGRAYAGTACGEYAYGRSPALTDLQQRVEQRRIELNARS